MSTEFTARLVPDSGRLNPGANKPATVSAPGKAEPPGQGDLAEVRKAKQEKDASALQDRSVDPADLEELVDELNDTVQSVNRVLEFSVDQDSGLTVISVSNKETGELIRQIPPEEVVALRKHLQEMRSLPEGQERSEGVLLSAKA
ncbi:MAG: flagellar protein FlaG [Chromatiales bacterium]|nr:flagellar protein FlaG [Chromatiales bacterium]